MLHHSEDVFINCPFDELYRPMFEGILFTVAASGFVIRCALEEENGADIRLNKLCNIIRECPRSIHDLSRIPVSNGELPRFNMPFELGLTIGSKNFGGNKFKNRTAVIMVKSPYSLPSYLSDLGGNDPHAHHDDIKVLIGIVRSYLGSGRGGRPLPGANSLANRLVEFQIQLPIMAAGADIDADEIDVFKAFRDYVYFLSLYLKEYPVI